MAATVRTTLPELDELERLIYRHEARLRVEMAGHVRLPHRRLPIYVLEMGSTAPDAPVLGVFGGVHGNERIGTKVVLAWLHSLLEQLRWDEQAQNLLERCRVVCMPLVNPGGMSANRRSTLDGIDLMRNAPVDADSAHWLLGGQRISRHLSWYRGKRGEMAPEAQALCRVVRERMHTQPFSLAVDCHSGFGSWNRIWFPYARTTRPIPHLAEIFALRSLFRTTYPHHISYRIEPQSANYTTHGDLWDYLYDEHLQQRERLFLPLTLEMGSWLWVRKNPLQLLQPAGMFNPLAPHRRRRILRQHLLWFDFLLRAVASFRSWLPHQDERDELAMIGREYWSTLASVSPSPSP